MDMIKVSANSRTSAVAGAIAGVIREFKHAEVQAIGAGAVNQAVKALVLATGYLKIDGIHVACVPDFVDVEIDLPDNPNWEHFKFRLEGMEQMTAEAWETFRGRVIQEGNLVE